MTATQPTTPEGPTDKPCPTCGGKREVEVPQDGTHDGVWFAPAPCPGCSAPGVREGDGLAGELCEPVKFKYGHADVTVGAGGYYTGGQLRKLCEVPDDYDLWEVVPGASDRLLKDTTRVMVNAGTRLYSAPRHINNSAPATPVREDEGLAAAVEGLRECANWISESVVHPPMESKTARHIAAEPILYRTVKLIDRLATPAPPSPESGQDGWQPIETAPKDGTWILIWGEQWSGAPIPDVGHWDDDDWRDDEHTVLAFATHWMPLPAPPSEGSKS